MDHRGAVDALRFGLNLRRERFAIGVEEGLESEDPCLPLRQPRRRPVDSDGKPDMRDADEVRTQFEHGRGCGKTAAEPTTVAVSGIYVGRLSAV
jgi:hypothetical protein